MGSRRYLLSKTLQAVVTLLFVLTFNFFLFRLLPGDPVALLTRSEKLTPDDIARLQHDLGLDLPMVEQYGVYLRETLTGNLGEALTTGIPVTDLIKTRLWPTVLLGGLGTILSAWLGVVIGIRGGWRGGSRFDTTSQYGSLVLYAMPEGWLGMLLLLLFSGMLHWFPAGGYASSTLTGTARIADLLDHLFLPLLTLTLGYIGSFSIVMRSSMIDTIAEDYVQTARAKGVPDRLIRQRHVLPNAFLPAFTLIILSFGFVLGGAIVIESVYSWPGLGLLTYQAINTLDYPVIQGVFLIASAAVIVANLVADVTYGYLDPRIRQAWGGQREYGRTTDQGARLASPQRDDRRALGDLPREPARHDRPRDPLVLHRVGDRLSAAGQRGRPRPVACDDAAARAPVGPGVARDRQLRAFGARPVDRGRPCLAGRRAHRSARRDADRRSGRYLVRVLRWDPDRRGIERAHELVPGDPLACARDRAGHRARREPH